MSDLRDKIARALFDGVFPTKSPEWLDQEWEARERRRSGKDGDYECRADAVLAVLADLPESVIERAARELFLEDANVAYAEWPEWDSPENLGKPIYIENARAAFRAAFGGEQG